MTSQTHQKITASLVLGPQILQNRLEEYGGALAGRLFRHGHLILSGPLSTDVPSTLGRYRDLALPHRAQFYERGQWRAVGFSP
jgi:hypothetical protein